MTIIRSGTFHDDGSIELWPPTETGKVPMNGRDLPRAQVSDLTDEERALAAKCREMLGSVYDRLAKVAGDASLAAAYEAHPEIGEALEAKTMALAKANARLVELGEKPVEVAADVADAKAESPEKSTDPAR